MKVRNAIGRWQDGWFAVPHDVEFRDIDYFGHVNNAVYFSYFEWARTLLWFELTGGVDPGEIGFIVARAECDFRKQIELEPIDIRVRVGEIRNTSLEFLSEIWKDNGAELAATGRVVAVLWDWKTNAKRTISDEFRNRVEGLQKSS